MLCDRLGQGLFLRHLEILGNLFVDLGLQSCLRFLLVIEIEVEAAAATQNGKNHEGEDDLGCLGPTIHHLSISFPSFFFYVFPNRSWGPFLEGPCAKRL